MAFVRRSVAGFTLIEVAVASAIIALLIGGLLTLLSGQSAAAAQEETKRRLSSARELVLAFAITNGRLPCPARSVATSSPSTPPGFEVRNSSTGACTGDSIEDNYGGTLSNGATGGLLPARSLGFVQVDSDGFALDAWGNRLRYAVARSVYSTTAPYTVCRPGGVAPLSPPFTHQSNLTNNGMLCNPSDLVICSSSPASPASTTCDSGTRVTGPAEAISGTGTTFTTGEPVVAIIWSVGPNGATGGSGVNEARNLDGGGTVNPLFVDRRPDPSSASGGEFDDLLTWIPVSDLYQRLVAAGRLP